MINSSLDTGAQLTFIRKGIIKNLPESDRRFVNLISAFNQKVRAELYDCKMKLNEEDDFIYITIAITPELSEACLLSQ